MSQLPPPPPAGPPPPPGPPVPPGPAGQPGWGAPGPAGQPGWGAPTPQVGWTPPGPSAPNTWADPSVKPPASAAAKQAGWVIAGAGALVVVAAFLPWLTLSGPGADAVKAVMEAQDEGLNGLDKDGALTIVLGLVVVVMGVLRGTGRAVKGAAITGLVLGLLTALIGLIDLADVQSVKDDISGLPLDFQVGAGIGLWLTLLGGVAVAGSSFWALRTE